MANSIPGMKYTANQVYKVIKPFNLTQEQEKAVQEASVTMPSLVVAGAGSGKTELMAVRVLWLVANGFAKPSEILGLTFTRKAAAELSKRIYESLLKLRDSDMWPQDLDYDFTAPTISTYNAYANNLFRDNALAIGFEPEAALLTEAAAFQLAREVVLKQGSQVDSRLAEIDTNLNSIVENVLALAQSMNDNLVGEQEVSAQIDDVVAAISDLPQKTGSTNTAPYSYLTQTLQPLAITPIIAKLAQAYRQTKLQNGFVDYSDQVALAELAVREVPGLREREREIHTQVLLDEYQDTSFLQTKLLQYLFAGTSVFAVGDPNQSIYGWRGASASNLNSFYADFKAPADAVSFTLSTSWRNPQTVLTLANKLIDELKVVELVPAPKAQQGSVEVLFEQDLHSESIAVANWLKTRMAVDQTGALLMRKRSQMPVFVEALENAGLEVEVVGLGGLLEVPEIVDLVSALRVINDPAAGSQLIRLLTGPRWRIGAKDLERLHKYANLKARVQDELREKIQAGLAPEDSLSIVDALDLLPEEKDAERFGFSEVGLIRLRDAARLLRAMRQQSGMTLVEYVRSVEQELWLDIEVQANPRRKNPMSHLNGFAAIVAGYSVNNSQPNLGAFLNWLEFADERERFEVPSTNPEKGVVQVLTIHAAKGLEWDHVAVSNLIEGDFPATGKGISGWLGIGKLPFPLRGDHASLPVWNYKNCTTQSQVKSSTDDFKENMRKHLFNEELRLMYVAVTRPKRELLLTGSYWKPGNKNARKASTFLIRCCEHLGIEIPDINSDVNPISLESQTESWPLDPLGERHRIDVERAAKQTRESILKLEAQGHGQEVRALLEGDEIQNDISLLLAEKEQDLLSLGQVKLPVRIPASSFKDFVSAFEETTARLKRPMPQPPYKQTRAGTLFHGWVEQYFGSRHLVDSQESLDSDSGALNEEDIQQLKANFANSRFANLTPIDVEREIQLTIGGNTFICKLDAVFETADGALIVDWKTGKSPKDAADEKLKTLQLALYRLAYSEFTGRPLSEISVCFYFVAENVELIPSHIPDGDELRKLWLELN